MKQLVFILLFISSNIWAQGDFGHLSEQDNEPLLIETNSNSGLNTHETIDTNQQIVDTIINEPLVQKNEPIVETERVIIEKQAGKAIFESFLFYLLIACILGFISVYAFYPVFFKSVYKSVINFRQSNLVFEDLTYRENLPMSLLLLNAIVVYSAVVSTLFYYFYPAYFVGNFLLVWFVSLLVVFVLVGAKQAVVYFLSQVLPFKQTMLLYNFNIQITTISAAVSLLCCLCLLCFGQLTLTKIAIIVGFWFVFQLFRVFRGGLVAKQKIIAHPFYFFLYLCTLEISPLLILYKIAESLNGQVV